MFNKVEKITKSNEEQAVASWINYLNQVRLDELTDLLNQQDVNLTNAMNTLKDTLEKINKEIIFNGAGRGGHNGMHGFIAEIAECGIGNARSQIIGNAPNYEWINDNGMVDLKRGTAEIQQKFVQSGGHLSLNAIRDHYNKYPDYLDGNRLYQIPKDHYDKIKYYLSINKEEAYKMPTQTGEFSLKQWKEVHNFFEKGDIPFQKIEPSTLRYGEVQRGTIDKTIHKEEISIKQKNRKLRDSAYEKSKPTFNEGVKTTALSGFIEGGTTFTLKLVEKRKTGKQFQDFDEEDWKKILGETSKGTFKGGFRGASIYMLTNYTATPASVASAMVTCSFSVADIAHHFRIGELTEEEFLLQSEIVCLDASVSALSSFIGQAIIPIPVLGAVIGNTVGNVLYQATKEGLSKHEEKLIQSHLAEIHEYNKKLDQKYKDFILGLTEDLNKFMELLNKAFAPDYRVALEYSVQLAIRLGVDEKELLKNESEIDEFFMK